MPANRDLDILADLAEEAAEYPEWTHFADFCRLRARGLRRPALESLRLFIAETRGWIFDDRLRLVQWIARGEEGFRFGGLLIPQPLHADFVAPTVREWLEREPRSAEAHYFEGIYGEHGADRSLTLSLDCFRRAVELDPTYWRARRAFAKRVVPAVEYAQHELPDVGYLGSVGEDIRDLREALGMLTVHEPELERSGLKARLTDLLETALAWQAFHDSEGDSFADWCLKNDGPRPLMDRLRR